MTAEARIRLVKLLLEGVQAAIHQFRDELLLYNSDLYYDIENAVDDAIAQLKGHLT